VARAVVLDRNLRDYLEALCARAYLCVYGPHERLRHAVWRFLVARFPDAVRGAWPQILQAAAALLLGGLTAFGLVGANLEVYWHFVDTGMAQGRDPTSTVAELREPLFDDGDTGLGGLGAFAAFLFSHNARIGIMAFGLGLLTGVPVLLLVFYQGLVLGAMTALYHERGLAAEWWSWILPHGITELGAVVLCGAAGLMIGDAIVFPGRHGRPHALATRGRQAGVIVFGCVVMFFVAGLIEGIFRQTVQSLELRYLLAAVTAAGWLVYFRSRQRTAP
jgi:uncharacterized membrane protein SpoIIM required for sporulation